MYICLCLCICIIRIHAEKEMQTREIHRHVYQDTEKYKIEIVHSEMQIQGLPTDVDRYRDYLQI